MRSIKPAEIEADDAIIVSHRRRVVTAVTTTSSGFKVEIGESGSIFLKPDDQVTRFEESEVVYCNACERRNTHVRGVCVECGTGWFEPSTPLPKDARSSPPPPQRPHPLEQSPPPGRGVHIADLAGLVSSLVGTMAIFGGIALNGLAIWLWHLTDTSRISGFDESMRALERESGITTMNEFHVIAFGLGICGVLFLGLGIGLLATFWFADRSD